SPPPARPRAGPPASPGTLPRATPAPAAGSRCDPLPPMPRHQESLPPCGGLYNATAWAILKTVLEGPPKNSPPACPRSGYSRIGLASGTACPECGEEVEASEIILWGHVLQSPSRGCLRVLGELLTELS